MSNAVPPPPPPPGQTIVIERRERVGIVRRVITLVFILFLVFLLFGGLLPRESGLPTRLAERYVAGEIAAAKIAVVEVEGMILDANVNHVIRQLRQARDDDTVKAVILRVDSPGGSVSGSDRIWREVEVLKRAGKPVVASLGGMAASGGYYVAAPADHILAEPTTLTGSIGVILELPNLKGLLDKVGVEFETITTGPWKDSGSLFRPMTAEERTRWRELIEDSYQRFIRIVARGRRLSLSEVTTLANGQVYTADEAVKRKLVNELGYLDDAILVAQRLAKLESARVVRYARPLNWSEALLSLTAPRPGLGFDAESMLKLQVPRLLYLAP
jgi:protease-4